MGNNVGNTKNMEQGKKKFCFHVLTGKQIQDAEVPETNYLVEGIITPGLNLLAAPRKKGKSWMALDIALCVAGKEDFMGRRTEHGKVLYFALEDNSDRMKRRIDAMMDDADSPEGLLVSFSSGYAGDSFFKDLDAYLDTDRDIKLVIIDVLQKVRMDKDSNQTEYSHDYKECGGLKDIADRHGISVLLVHHTRKTRDKGNPLNEIAGGVGITSVTDTILMLMGGALGKQNILYVVSRDMPEQQLSVVFDTQTHRWKYIGTKEEMNIRNDEDEYAKSPVIRTVKAMLEGSGSWNGTISELVEQSKGITNELADMSASALSRKINKFDEFLKRDGIMHTRPDPNGGLAGRKHKFVRQDMASGLPETDSMNISPEELSVMEEAEYWQSMSALSLDDEETSA